MTLREHYVVLLHSLQVDPVLPLLHAEGLLTKSEYDKLQSPEMLALQGTARCDQLLRWLPNKGRNYFTKFCICIGRSGQMDLLRRIGFDLSLIPDEPTLPPLTYQPHPQPGPTPTITTTQTTPFNQQTATHPVNQQIATPTTQQSTPPTTQRLLILYSNDPLVSTSLPQEARHTQAEYLQRVSDFVQTLQLFSTVGGADGRGQTAYTCIYDVFECQREHISNFMLWSARQLELCDAVLLLMSPQVGMVLRGGANVMEMEKGLVDTHTLVNALPRKRVLPVYLNIPRVLEWLPRFLRSTPVYSVDLLALQRGMGEVASEEELARRAYLLLDEDPNLKDLRDLLAVLRREPPPDNPRIIIDLPSAVKAPSIQARYLDIVVPKIYHIWERLGLKMGFTFSELESIRFQSQDNPERSIRSMFTSWQERDGEKATLDALIDALMQLNLNGIVAKLKLEMQKDSDKNRK